MREPSVKEYTYSRKYKFTFIWLSNILLVLLTLSVVYWKPLLALLNFIVWSINYYFLANSFNKKIFVHFEGKFVYRNVFRRRLSFNVDEIEEIKATTVRKGLMLKLKDGKGFVYLTPYWRNWKHLFRFVINRTDPAKIVDRDKVLAAFDL
ncbi:hypothetical protein GC194_01190 [bacterium]|nr:hypothetical protein [bacterium]